MRKRGASIIDERFGRLVVKAEAGKNGSGKIKCLCLCDCGNKKTILKGDLFSGATKSCGCLRDDKTAARSGEKHPNYIDGRKYDKEYKKKYMSEYYKENRDKLLKDSNSYSKKNKLEVAERQKRYREKYPDKITELSNRKRARKRNQTPILTENEKRKTSLYYQIAVYLGKEFHVDHIHPLSKGGLHHPDNLQILTAEVNMEKHNKWPLTEAEEIKYQGIRI